MSRVRHGKAISGIESLDSIIEGFPEGSVIVLIGKPGSGFELFTLQLLFNRCNLGGKAVYMNIDRRMDDVLMDLNSKNWYVDEFINEGKWRFLDAFSIRMEMARGAYDRSLNSLIGEYIKEVGMGAWGAIDTFSYFLKTMEDPAVLRLIDTLIGASRDSGSIQLLMLLDGLHSKEVITRLAHLVDGVMGFSLSEDVEPTGMIEIDKFRLMEYAPRKLVYRITDRGLVIETLSRIA